MRVLVVGSSHMVALRQAAEAGSGLSGVETTFRGLGGREFLAIDADQRGIFVRPETLVLPDRQKASWGPLDEVVPYEEFDGFVVSGVTRTALVLRSFVMQDMHGHSEAYLKAALEAFVARDHSVSLAASIARHGGRPVALATMPLPAEPRPNEPDRERAWRRTVAWLGRAAAIRGVTFVPQPEATLERFAWTLPRFAVGSVRLSGRAHPVEERLHMNAHFGAIALPPLLQAVAGALAEAA